MLSMEEDVCVRQQAVLDRFFDLIGHFNFDKAKEYLEKERDAAVKGHRISQFFSTALTAFSQLAVAEKNYASLSYLGPKGFLRKDSSLKSMFESLRNEIRRLEDKHYVTPISTPTISPTLSSRTPSPPSVTPSPSPSETSGSALSSLSVGNSSVMGNSVQNSSSYPGSDVLENLVCHLCGQLLHFIAARLEMMEFYECLCAVSNVRFMNTEQLLETVSKIAKNNQKLFHHPLLSSLKSSFSLECDILVKLLECQVNMQVWKFLPSLLALHEAHSKLQDWILVPKEVKKGTNVATTVRHPSPPILYQKLCSLKAALVSKFTLYFHDVLSKQTTPQEMKNLCSRTFIDYFQKIVSFQKKCDAACVAIVLDTNDLHDYRGHGYICPEKYFETPKGLNSYPAIVCYPPEKPVSHWPSVVMIMDKHEKELKTSDSIVTFYDKRVNSTYYLARLEPRMTLVIIFASRKSERDTNITGFMNPLCAQLRCNKVFASLKPGSKNSANQQAKGIMQSISPLFSKAASLCQEWFR